MFTGIVQAIHKVVNVDKRSGLTHFSVDFSPAMLEGLQIGASVSLDGVCQTVVRIEGHCVWFDAIRETLKCTTLQDLHPGRELNVERSAKLGDEVGGHILSGHVCGKAQITRIDEFDNNRVLTLKCSRHWAKYLFSKGYVALDGASLTLVDAYPEGTFTVHLIPETLRKSILGQKIQGDWVNLEIDSQTQAVVETVERILSSKK